MITTIKKDMVQAMKDKNKNKVTTLRMLLSTIDTERGKLGLKDVSDFKEEQVIGLINRNIKQINQEIDSLKIAKRDFSMQQEQKTILEEYLPAQMSAEEILSYVNSAISAEGFTDKSQKGKLMGILSKQLKGKADMGLVSKFAKDLLGG